MKKVLIIMFSMFMLSNIAWAGSVIQPTTNSLSQAVLEINAMHAPPQTNMTPAKAYTNESQKNNSLFSAALAMQEAHMKSDANDKQIRTETNSTTKHQNSFYGAILDKQFSRYK